MPKGLRTEQDSIGVAFPSEHDGCAASPPSSRVIRLSPKEGKIYLDMIKARHKSRRPLTSPEAQEIVRRHSETKNPANCLFTMVQKGVLVRDSSRVNDLDREPVTEGVIVVVGKRPIWPKGAVLPPATEENDAPAPDSSALFTKANALLAASLQGSGSCLRTGRELGVIFAPLGLTQETRVKLFRKLISLHVLHVVKRGVGQIGSTYRVTVEHPQPITPPTMPPPKPEAIPVPKRESVGVSGDLLTQLDAKRQDLHAQHASLSAEDTALDDYVAGFKRKQAEELTALLHEVEERRASIAARMGAVTNKEEELDAALREALSGSSRLRQALADA